MLKIKDDVKLEKLKDYGFILYHSIDDGQYYWCIYDLFIGNDRIIHQDDGINYCMQQLEYELCEDEIDKLFDLIQAGLVEKVEVE